MNRFRSSHLIPCLKVGLYPFNSFFRYINTTLTTKVSLDISIPPNEIAKLARVPENMLNKLSKPRMYHYATLLAKANIFDTIIRTNGTDPSIPLKDIRKGVEKQGLSEASLDSTPNLRTTSFTSIYDLILCYEKTIHPIRCLNNALSGLKLEGFHLSDILKRGTSAFSQEYLDKTSKEHKVLKEKIDGCQEKIQNAIQNSFDTVFLNNFISILYLSGKKNPDANELAAQVLDELASFKVPFDDFTEFMLRTILFNDNLFEDSSLLFSAISYPEMGELTIKSSNLQDASNMALNTASTRHELALDENGIKLESNETFPCLEYSVE